VVTREQRYITVDITVNRFSNMFILCSQDAVEQNIARKFQKTLRTNLRKNLVEINLILQAQI